MSRAVVATGFGGPEVLSVVDETVPDPGPGQVLIDVRAIGVNPIDFKLYSGLMGSDPSHLPMRLGSEASGVVAAVGDGATGANGPVAVGDEVIAYRAPGAYAERLLVAGSSLVPKPGSMTFAQAGGLMLTGATAVHALAAASVGAGDTVLIHAASGGVGLMAVQVALARGATVIGTASPPQHELLRSFGVLPVAYGPGLAERVRALAPSGVDSAIDCVGTDEAIDTSVELVADRSRIATIAAFQRGFQLGVKVLGGAPGADAGVEIRDAARMELVRLFQEAKLEILVGATYALEEAAAAHRDVAGGHTTGKVVLLAG